MFVFVGLATVIDFGVIQHDVADFLFGASDFVLVALPVNKYRALALMIHFLTSKQKATIHRTFGTQWPTGV